MYHDVIVSIYDNFKQDFFNKPEVLKHIRKYKMKKLNNIF